VHPEKKVKIDKLMKEIEAEMKKEKTEIDRVEAIGNSAKNKYQHKRKVHFA